MSACLTVPLGLKLCEQPIPATVQRLPRPACHANARLNSEGKVFASLNWCRSGRQPCFRIAASRVPASPDDEPASLPVGDRMDESGPWPMDKNASTPALNEGTHITSSQDLGDARSLESSSFHRDSLWETNRGGGGGGGEGSGGGGGDDQDDDGTLLLWEEVKAFVGPESAETLPTDMRAMAVCEGGLLKSVILRHQHLQQVFIAGALAALFPSLRDRMLADNRFFFKLLTTISVESGLTFLAEMQHGAAACVETLEFLASELLVGIVLDCFIVTLLAPACVLGTSTKAVASAARATGNLATLRRALASLPSSAFAASQPGQTFTVAQRAAAFIVRGAEFSALGAACGYLGQATANAAYKLKHDSDAKGLEPSPSKKTALLWAKYMGFSANSRFHLVVGVERLFESSSLVQQRPWVAFMGILGIRMLNSVVGGEQFSQMARSENMQ